MFCIVELSEESNPFCSLNETGSYILCTSVHDMAKSRYNLCCSLLLFLEYLTYLSEEVCIIQHSVSCSYKSSIES